MQENWKQYPHDKRYEVSDAGRVRSVPRTQVYTRKSGKVITRKHAGRMIRECQSGWCGLYRHVSLGAGRLRLVHVLVLETFVGPRPEGNEARHLNGVHHDNRLCNLAWGSRSQNQSDRVAHGTDNRGDNAPWRKINGADVLEMRRAYAAGEATFEQLAKRYGVSGAHVCATVRGRFWGHLPGAVKGKVRKQGSNRKWVNL